MAYRKQAVRNYKLLNLKRKVRFWWIRALFTLCVVIVFLFAYLFYFNQSLLPEFVAEASSVDNKDMIIAEVRNVFCIFLPYSGLLKGCLNFQSDFSSP